MYRKQMRRRRGVLVVLAVVSLILISATFSESDSGPLRSIQEAVNSVTGPLEEGASRALKPGRDFVNWFDETFEARGENERLRAEVEELRTQLAEAQSAVAENREFRKLLRLGGEPALGGFEPVTARVIERSPTVWYASIGIDAGSGDGIDVNDPVITGDGLVGRVTDVSRGGAQVALITDHRTGVSARVVPGGTTGFVEPEVGDPEDLLLDFIEGDERVKEGEMLVTAGWSNGQISSAFPPGIPIGEVTETTLSAQGSTQQAHVRPYARIRDLDWVQVLAGGPSRPGVPR